MRTRTPVALLTVALCATTALPAQAQAPTDTHIEGRLPSGAAYLMDVPADWNGTVLLFSHGYRPVSSPNPGQNSPDSDSGGATTAHLLAEGYALIGSSYATNGWAVTDAVPDQLATLDLFTKKFGPARRTLAWGRSYGGLVTTALAERHADRFDGSLSMCGLVQGGVANWNSTLDPVFALKTLLAPDADIPLAGFADQASAVDASKALTAKVASAQQTPHGPRPDRTGRRPAQHPRLQRPRTDRAGPGRLGRAAGQPVRGRHRSPDQARLLLAAGGGEPRRAATRPGTPVSTTPPCSGAPRCTRR